MTNETSTNYLATGSLAETKRSFWQTGDSSIPAAAVSISFCPWILRVPIGIYLEDTCENSEQYEIFELNSIWIPTPGLFECTLSRKIHHFTCRSVLRRIKACQGNSPDVMAGYCHGLQQYPEHPLEISSGQVFFKEIVNPTEPYREIADWEDVSLFSENESKGGRARALHLRANDCHLLFFHAKECRVYILLGQLCSFHAVQLSYVLAIQRVNISINMSNESWWALCRSLSSLK